jgi:hypothetical protein
MNWNPEKIDTEWLAFRRGLRPAIRIAVGQDWVDKVAKRFRNMGAKVERSDDQVEIDGRTQWVLYLSRQTETAQQLKANEAPLFFDADQLSVDEKCDRHRVMGQHLGFPACCVESYCVWTARGVGRLSADSDIMASETYIAAREAWIPQPSPLLNDLFTTQRVRLISFYPCRYDCAVALALAEKVVEEIHRHHPKTADLYLGALKQSVVVGSWGQIAIMDQGQRADGLCVVAEASAPPGPEDRPSDRRDVDFAQTLKGLAFDSEGLQVDQVEPRTLLFNFGAGP